MNLKKLFIFGLSALLLTGALTSCNPSNGGPTSEEPATSENSDDSLLAEGTILASYKSNLGNHEYTVKVGSNYIEDYKILISNEEGIQDELEKASTELQYFINLSSGVMLDIVTDAEYDANQNYLSLGKTKAYKNAAVNFSQEVELGRSGVLIKSDKKNVYILGGHQYGVVYSVYEFLKHEIGFETYGANEFVYTTKTRLKVHNFNLIEVPDIELRIATHGNVANSVDLRTRMRFNGSSTNTGDIWMGPHPSYPYHNTFQWFPKAKYQTAHPKWYSTTGEQICFTAHGDEKEFEIMFDTFMTDFIRVLEQNPKCTTISITQEDRNVWCQCDACSALFQKYGTDAASVILFCNKVSDAYEEYKKEKGIERNVDILFFAYHKTTDAPCKKDATGKWVPIDKEVIARPNVGCFYAPIYADYRSSMNHERNKSFYDTMDKWTACTNILYLWFYGTNFSNYFLPINCFATMGDNYKFAYQHNAVYMYDQGQWNNATSTGFSWLKQYLQSKLQWDASLNQQDLIENFFKAWFKDAAAPMLELFNRWVSYSTYMYLENGEGITIYTDGPSKELFPKSEIDAYLGLIKDAYQAIEGLKEKDSGLYYRLNERILLESMAWRYIDHDLYASYYSAEQRTAEWKQFEADVNTLGISHLSETQYVSTLFGDF